MQDPAFGVQHDNRHHGRDRSGVLPQPIGCDFKVCEPAEASGRHGPNHEGRRQLTVEGNGHDQRLSRLESQQLGGARAQRRLATRQQAVSVDDDHRLERSGVGYFLFESRSVVAHIAVGEHLNNGFGGSDAVADDIRVTGASALEPLASHVG